MMSLDNGATDRQADAHAVSFCCIKCVEKLVRALSVDSHAGVPNAHTHAIAILPFCSDHQPPRSILHVNHRVRGVAEQIQDDLLELNTIAGYVREAVSELRLKHDPVSLKVTSRQRYDLLKCLVQIQRLEPELLLAEERTQPCNHLRRAPAIANGPPRRLARSLDVRRIGIQHPQARTGVRDDARKRLVDLMGN